LLIEEKRVGANSSFFFFYVKRPDEGRSKQTPTYLISHPIPSLNPFTSNLVFQTAFSYQRSKSHYGVSQQMLKEIRETQTEKSMNSRLGKSSP
jgi:hypothetical protein